MAKEKIKVSFLIDKDAVKETAFGICKTPDEYNEVEAIISNSEELVRDATSEEDEEKKAKMYDLFSVSAVDIIMMNNKDLLLTKRADAFTEKHDKTDDDDANIQVLKLDGGKVKEIIKSIFGKED